MFPHAEECHSPVRPLRLSDSDTVARAAPSAGLDKRPRCSFETAYNRDLREQMQLATGVRLGTYEIISLLGTVGMCEVYRAKDSRLKREVALKVLPEAFSQDADRWHGSSARRNCLPR